MPKFKCSYAVDVPHYFDFTVEAPDEAAAEKLIEQALEAGAFSEATVTACFENECNARVFLSDVLKPDDFPDAKSLVQEQGKFSLVPSS